MNIFCWKILLFILTAILSIELCCAQWSNLINKDYSHDKDDKPKPYEFNDAELTAIQALVAFREVIGELLQKVGIGWPNLGSILSNADNLNTKTNLQYSNEEALAAASATATKGTAGFASALLRGVALSLPLLIPMATTIRRMSTDQYVPPLPFIPDPYYNSAMHRRRGRSIARSANDYADNLNLKHLESIIAQINSLSRKYEKPLNV